MYSAATAVVFPEVRTFAPAKPLFRSHSGSATARFYSLFADRSVPNTVNEPNRCPVKSLGRASQPQLFVTPFFNFLLDNSISLPQSQRQCQIIHPFFRLSVLFNTVNFPYRFPVSSRFISSPRMLLSHNIGAFHRSANFAEAPASPVRATLTDLFVEYTILWNNSMYVFYNFMSNLSMVAPSPTLTLSDNREFVRNIRDLSPKYGEIPVHSPSKF